MSEFSKQIDVTDLIDNRIELKEKIKNRKFFAVGLIACSAFLGITAIAQGTLDPSAVAAIGAIGGVLLSRRQSKLAKEEEVFLQHNFSLSKIREMIKVKGWENEFDFVSQRKNWLTKDQQIELGIQPDNEVLNDVLDKIKAVRDKIVSVDEKPSYVKRTVLK